MPKYPLIVLDTEKTFPAHNPPLVEVWSDGGVLQRISKMAHDVPHSNCLVGGEVDGVLENSNIAEGTTRSGGRTATYEVRGAAELQASISEGWNPKGKPKSQTSHGRSYLDGLHGRVEQTSPN